MDAYQNDYLDKYNTFKNNIIYSKWSGDSISFSLQSDGVFEHNVVRGGKIAIYMCKKILVSRNYIFDSVSNGMYISFPSHNLTIRCNKFYECTASAIKLANQAEHGNFDTSDYFINIYQNYIYDSKLYGIEINNGKNINIYKNKIVSTDVYCIYSYLSQNINIHHNRFYYFNVVIWFESTSDSLISDNAIYSVYPDNGDNICKIINNSINNIITYNASYGKIINDKYISDSNLNIFIDNTHNDYFDYDEEFDIIK